jgi:apolipoprotein N-acyltransferase
VDDGAQVLVAITNDAWYGRTGAPHQFLAITAMRAAETGVALVRAANTGVSGLIDETGRVQAQSGLFERGYVIGDVRLAGTTAPTFYARHGDRFVQACWAGAAWVVVRALRRRRDDGTQVDSGSGVAPRPAA